MRLARERAELCFGKSGPARQRSASDPVLPPHTPLEQRVRLNTDLDEASKQGPRKTTVATEDSPDAGLWKVSVLA